MQMQFEILRYSDEENEDADVTILGYRFTTPMMTTVYQEYLIFDMVGLIGSVGGTLGMCIGFSFSGVTSSVLDFLESKLKLYF